MFYRAKKLLAIGLCVSMVLGAGACGKKNEEGGVNSGNVQGQVTEELAPEYVYAAEYVTVEEGTEMYDPFFAGDTIYSLGGNFNEETGVYIQSLNKYSISDGALKEAGEVMQLGNNTSVNRFTVTDKNEIVMVVSCYGDGGEDPEENPEAYYNSQKYYLQKYSADGEKIMETDLQEITEGQEWFYAEQLAVDSDGRFYMEFQGEVYLFDNAGKYAGKFSVGNGGWINGMGTGKDGKVYASYYRNEGNGGIVLSVLDFEGKKAGDTYENFISGNGGFKKGVEGDFIVSDEKGLYSYVLADQKMNKILTWLDSDINGSYVNGFDVKEDGSIVAFIRDWESNQSELALMKKVKADELVKKETITIGTLYGNSNLSRYAVEYNKKSDRYRISIKTYIDVNNWTDTSYQDGLARLTSDMGTGNAPDILDISGIDISSYVKKGAVEDLNPYLEKSSVVKKQDFLEKIIEGSTFDGVLAYVPTGFTLQTLAGKTSVVGDKKGWTVADMVKLKKEYPKAALMEYSTKESQLQMMMMLNGSRFMDPATGKCSFDSQEFKDILEFANTFPDDYENADNRLTPYKLADNSLLLSEAYISSFNDIQSSVAYFGEEEVTFIGYPSVNGSNGCLLQVDGGYAISSASSCKDAAWDFLETVITADVLDNWGFYGFSTRKAVFEQQKEKAMKVEYVLDENGDPYLDEDGEPVISGGIGGWTMIGDDGEEWTFKGHPLTVEEADLVEELLSDAVCISYNYDEKLMELMQEEAAAYFKGDKSVDEVAGIIQNRIGLYLKENME